MPNQPANDIELEAVAADIRSRDPKGERTAKVLRETFDQIYNGQRTGRYRWEQLYKTEKTHFGTLVEINLCREFGFEDGILLDYKIAGAEVDCKYSQDLGGWMIPPEAQNQICILVSAIDNDTPKWNMGLVRASAIYLSTSSNRDSKTKLNKAGREAIVWLFKDVPLPPNVLLQIDKEIVERIMSLRGERLGQKRINELLRNAFGMIIGRAAIATVGQQHDYMKRLRANGGARTTLKPEGIIVLGQYESHAAIARAFGIPVPGDGDTVSVRVALATKDEEGAVKIDDRFWRVAQQGDKIVPAPDLPKI